MELILKTFLFTLLLAFINEAKADGKHPHGKGEVLIKIERIGDIAKFDGNEGLIERTFAHDQVKDRKIVVFSIIGAYRQGKSFFLDYCLRYLYANYRSINTNETKTTADWLGNSTEPLSGFSWKHGSTSDTKGLMMWSDVFLYDAPNGEKIAIVIIDTQGLFERNSNEEENAKIFSFSTLVSSIQIINIKERIQENQIGHLQTAIELTNLITMKQQGHSRKKAFQNLIFLLRDFEDEKYKFGFEGGRKYFRDFFENSHKNEKSSRAEVNRNSIRESFDEIFCFLLNYPGENVRKSTFKGEWGTLKPEFVENLWILIESLLAPEKLVKKSFLGNEMTGKKFKDILIGLSKSYSTYKMPQVENIFQLAIDNQMSAIVKDKVKNYKTAMTSEAIDYDRSAFAEWLQRKHKVTLTQAVDEFLRAEKIEDKTSEEKFKKALEDEIEEFFKTFEKSTMEAYTTIKVEKEMQAIVVKKLTDYRRKINEDVNYELENFEQAIDEKHQNFKIIFSAKLMAATQVYNDTARSEKFKQKLEDEIEKSFQTWKETVLKHRNEILVNKVSNFELQNYRQKINNENDFDKENFEVYINMQHWSFKAEAIQEFSNSMGSNFDDEIVKKTKKSLEAQIDGAYKILKPPKMEIYRLIKERNNLEADAFLGQLVALHLDAYEQNFVTSIVFGIENFEQELLKTFHKCKNAAIDDFKSATDKPEYALKKSGSFNDLNQKIRESFNVYKTTAIAENNKILEQNKANNENKIAELADKSFLDFKRKIRAKTYSDANFAEDSFEIFLKNIFEATKDESIENFKLDTNIFSDRSTRRRFTNELSSKIDSLYQNWRADVLGLKAKYDEQETVKTNNKLREIVDEKLAKYRADMGTKLEALGSEQSLNNAHSVAKNSAVNAFNSAAFIFSDLSSVQRFKSILEGEIEGAFTNIKADKKIEFKKLETTGIWVPWDGSRNSFPPHAVLSGFYNGSKCAVARFNGQSGEWCVNRYDATSISNSKITTARNFEILRHTKWTYIKAKEIKESTPITNDGEILCRYSHYIGAKHLGRQDEGAYCLLVYYDNGSPEYDYWGESKHEILVQDKS